jgi:hypothetical protein
MSNMQTAAGIRIDSVFIESHSDKRIDITDLFMSCSITENLNSPILRGVMLIHDAAAILSNLPLVGQEKVEIRVSKNDIDKTYNFRTTHVERQSPVNDFSVQFLVHLVEETYYNSNLQLISQSFNGPMSTIISTIYEDFLDSEVDAEESAGNYSVVVPRWNPYKTVGWCTQRMRDSNNIPMMLYNTLQEGTKIRSLKTLFEADSVETYYRRQFSNPSTAEQSQRGDHGSYDTFVQSPFRFLTLETGPMLEQLHKGAFASRTMLIDTKEKYVRNFDFNYDEQFDNMTHLSREPVYGDTLRFRDKPISESYDTTLSAFYVSSDAAPNMTYNADVLNITPFKNSYLTTLMSYRYRLNIPGRFDLMAGSVVDLVINKNRIQTNNDPDDANDSRRSGKHIITSLKHIFTRKGNGNDEYTINFDCARETMEKPYNARV